MTAAMLVSSVLPDTRDMAYAELYSDPPGLSPLPEEEPLIAKSVAKRRNEFITVRYCARIALGELGFPPVPILKGDKGEPCWPDGVLDAITIDEERHEIATLPAGLHWDRILFCAKEATYKAWFPLTKRWLGFEDAHIVFDVDSTGNAGDFVSKILIDGAALSGPPLTALRGRWSVDRELVLTAIVL